MLITTVTVIVSVVQIYAQANLGQFITIYALQTSLNISDGIVTFYTISIYSTPAHANQTGSIASDSATILTLSCVSGICNCVIENLVLSCYAYSSQIMLTVSATNIHLKMECQQILCLWVCVLLYATVT